MDAVTTERIKKQIEFEYEREAPPEGFPMLEDVPAGRYTDAAFFDLEQRHIWSRCWLLAGHVDQLADVGSYLLWTDSGAPIVIVRGADREIRAFYNTCQHRGGPLVREARGNITRFQCQYHSWVYDLEGALLAVPDERDFSGLDRSCRHLRAVRCELWGGFIFVNEDPAAIPLQDYLAPVPDEWSDLEVESLRFVEKHSIELACNWKVAVDAFLEVYHLRHIHVNTVNRLLDPRGAAMGLLPGGHSRMATPIRPENLVDGNVPSGFPEFGRAGEIPRITNLAYNLFPNFVVPLDLTGFPILMFWPLDIRRTRMDVLWFGGPDFEFEDGELPESWKRRLMIFDLVLDEDTQNLAWIQKSVESPGFHGVPLNYQERRIYHLHEEIDRVIGVEQIPEALRVRPLLSEWVEGS